MPYFYNLSAVSVVKNPMDFFCPWIFWNFFRIFREEQFLLAQWRDMKITKEKQLLKYEVSI